MGNPKYATKSPERDDEYGTTQFPCQLADNNFFNLKCHSFHWPAGTYGFDKLYSRLTEMEDSRSKKPLTDSEMEDKCGRSIAKQLSGPMKPNLLLLPSSASSSSKPPLGPVPLLLKNPNNSPSLVIPAIEALTVNSEQADNNEQCQTPESSAHKNNVETSDARKLKRVMSNRMSAYRSRLMKLEHVANLERQCAQLQNQISHLHPQIEAFANLKNMLMLEQNVLTQRVQALQNQTYVKQAEIEMNKAEVYELREIEKRQKEAEAQATMAFANWDTLPNDNNQQIVPNANIPAQGIFQNIEGTSGMEVDEETMNTNISASMNELDAIVNPPKFNDNKANSEFNFYF